MWMWIFCDSNKINKNLLVEWISSFVFKSIKKSVRGTLGRNGVLFVVYHIIRDHIDIEIYHIIDSRFEKLFIRYIQISKFAAFQYTALVLAIRAPGKNPWSLGSNLTAEIVLWNFKCNICKLNVVFTPKRIKWVNDGILKYFLRVGNIVTKKIARRLKFYCTYLIRKEYWNQFPKK